MKEGDRIVYDLTGETGIAGEFTQDGDVSITWDHLTKTPRTVKWNQCSPLCTQSYHDDLLRKNKRLLKLRCPHCRELLERRSIP